MYEYKFVRLHFNNLKVAPQVNYHAIIEENARNGWRLVQIFTPPADRDNQEIFYELIFEREKSDETEIMKYQNTMTTHRCPVCNQKITNNLSECPDCGLTIIEESSSSNR